MQKVKAKQLYWQGYTLAEISRQLNIASTTLSSWKKSDKWDDSSVIERMEVSIEARFIALMNKEQKSNADYKEIDAILKSTERVVRIRKFECGGNEATLNPKLSNRGTAPRKASEPNSLTDEQVETLINGFQEQLFAYQKEWHVAGLAYRIRYILKSRQIGATYYFAHEAFTDALKTGRNQIFLSASKKQALQFRSYIVQYCKDLTGVELKGETIKLHNGAELIFLGTNSATAQSYHGNVYIDEIFWIYKFDELRKVASAMASQKQYRQTYFSTPSTISHSAYPFWSGKFFNKNRKKSERKEFDISHDFLKNGEVCPDSAWRQIVNIFDAESKGCDLFDINALQLEYSHDEFQQLFMCEFIDDKDSVFNFNKLQQCFVDSLEVWDDYKPWLDRPFSSNEVWLGYDPARSGDRAALVLVAPPSRHNNKFRVLHTATFKGMRFDSQAEEIKKICEIYNVTHIAIDTTGIGSAVYDLVINFRPDALGINYNLDNKSRMVYKAVDTINRGRLEFDFADKEIITSFMSIRRRLTSSERAVTFIADTTQEASHADLAWALMHCFINEPFQSETISSTTSTMELM